MAMKGFRVINLLSLFLARVFLRLEALARQPVYGRKAMVVAQENLAADVGVSVLRSGGKCR